MKKIISLLTIFALLFTMMASLNATTVLADTETLYSFEHFKSSESKLYTGYNTSTGKYSGKYFQISGSDTVKDVTYHASIDGISTEPSLKVKSSKYIWSNIDGVSFTKPVMNFNFEMYIPTAATNTARQLFFYVAKKGTDYKNGNYGKLNIVLNSSKASQIMFGSSTENADKVKQNYVTVAKDKWHTVNLRIFTFTEGGAKKIYYGLYLGDTLVGFYRSTATDIRFDDIGIYQAYFDSTKDFTYIRNIRVDMEDLNTALLPDGIVPDGTESDGITLTYTKGTATASAPVAGGTPRLILAAYDTYGKMVTVTVSKDADINDGVVSLNLNTSGWSGVTKVKAFMFDSLTSCVPLFEHEELPIQ